MRPLANFLATLGLAEAAAALLVLALVILWIVQSAGNLEKVWAWLTAGRRAWEAKVNTRLDELEAANEQFMAKEAIRERFEKAEDRLGKVAVEVANQYNTLMESLRERERLIGEFRPAIEQLREKVHQLEIVPGRVDKLESKLDNLTQQITDLKTGQRELRNEMREDMKSNKGEILQAIKDIRS